ncbi:MAG: hypothetical protein MJZ19_11390 [Paludibacteraceae bacterium]|nr:hypothetical protein [Paludibacteraceae bacterium]
MTNVELKIFPVNGKMWTRQMPLTDVGVVELLRTTAERCKVMVCGLVGANASEVSRVEVTLVSGLEQS